jgi:hypothetical protein
MIRRSGSTSSSITLKREPVYGRRVWGGHLEISGIINVLSAAGFHAAIFRFLRNTSSFSFELWSKNSSWHEKHFCRSTSFTTIRPPPTFALNSLQIRRILLEPHSGHFFNCMYNAPFLILQRPLGRHEKIKIILSVNSLNSAFGID